MHFPLSSLALSIAAIGGPESQGSRSMLEDGTYSLACDTIDGHSHLGRVRLRGWLELAGGRGVDTFFNTASEAKATARLHVSLEEPGFDELKAIHQSLSGRYLVGQGRHELRLANELLELEIQFEEGERTEMRIRRKLRGGA